VRYTKGAVYGDQFRLGTELEGGEGRSSLNAALAVLVVVSPLEVFRTPLARAWQ
jgi:hypothetical protein